MMHPSELNLRALRFSDAAFGCGVVETAPSGRVAGWLIFRAFGFCEGWDSRNEATSS